MDQIPSAGFSQIHLGQPSSSAAPSLSQPAGGGDDRLMYKVEALERKLDTVILELQKLRRDLGH